MFWPARDPARNRVGGSGRFCALGADREASNRSDRCRTGQFLRPMFRVSDWPAATPAARLRRARARHRGALWTVCAHQA